MLPADMAAGCESDAKEDEDEEEDEDEDGKKAWRNAACSGDEGA